jgi:spermidine/putrescine transport system permease protein
MMRRGLRPQINALAVLLLAFTFLVAALGLYLRSRKT